MNRRARVRTLFAILAPLLCTPTISIAGSDDPPKPAPSPAPESAPPVEAGPIPFQILRRSPANLAKV